MKKDYYNEVIPPWDPRYGKIGHIRKSINSNKGLVVKLGNNNYRYFIHPFLVINEYVTAKTSVIKLIENNSDNWVDGKLIKRLLTQCTGLTDEEYYLLVYDSNNRLNYSRCGNCGSRLRFTNLLRGYCSGGRLPEDYIGPNLCSQSCTVSYKHKHPELYGDSGFNNWVINAKTKRSWFINHATSSTGYFYITTADGKFKYGITSDPDQRDYRYHSYNELSKDKNIKILLKSDIITIADLEYFIKLEMGTDKEYLPFDSLMFKFRLAFKNSYNKLFST